MHNEGVLAFQHDLFFVENILESCLSVQEKLLSNFFDSEELPIGFSLNEKNFSVSPFAQLFFLDEIRD